MKRERRAGGTALPILLLSVALLVAACREGGDLAGGSGSQTTNTLTGAIVDEGGRLQAGVRVRLIPAGYDPVAGAPLPPQWSDTTDALGRYRLSSISDGEYALEADHGPEGTVFAVLDLKLSGARTLARPADTLRAPGSIVVRLSAKTSHGGYLYVPGTSYCVRLAPTGDTLASARLEPLPPIVYPSVILQPAQGAPEEIAGGPFAVAPGAVTPAGPFSAWATAWPITLRAGAGGAGLRGGVHDFPLLVRLDSTFDFSRVRGDASDLRAADADGKPLPLDVERWDSTGRKAEIWIRLDSVPAGTTGAWLCAGHAGPAPAPAPAFDTAAGFAGVWHMQRLDRNPSDTADTNGIIPDATQGKTAARARNGAGRTFAEGPLGAAVVLDGVDDFLDLGNGAAVNPQGAAVIEAWIRPDRMPHTGTGFDDAMIMAKFDAYSLEFQADGSVEGWLRTGPDKTVQTMRGPVQMVPAGAWTHVAASYDGSAYRIYVNGAEIGSTPAAGAISASTQSCLIGFIEGWGDLDRHFAGAIDEVRISRVARGADWIKLGYETQKPGNGNVTVGRPVQ